ncbi:MAG TPA: hypothetical protein VNA44_03370 [Burkholderiaceae bacterium]|nr:hypothetical protein [Burkholderiaceae bacterium]
MSTETARSIRTIHALSTFGLIGLLGRDWEERRLKELMEEEQRRRA